MSNKLYLASLLPLLASATSLAQPHPLRPTAVLEIDTVSSQTHAKITSEQIWVNGAWTHQDFRSKTPTTTSGRVGDDQLRALRAELALAPWHHMYSQPPCPLPATTTEYRVDGKLVYTEPACGDNLDATSLAVLAYARGFVAGAIGTT
jgi:hypothetical protein